MFFRADAYTLYAIHYYLYLLITLYFSWEAIFQAYLIRQVIINKVVSIRNNCIA